MIHIKRLILEVRFPRLRTLITNFASNKRGNVAVISAIACLPLIAGVGCVIDYTMASMVKTKLQAAADTAAVATVSINSSAVATAKSMTGGGTVSGGSTFAINFFNANLSTSPANTGYTNLASTASVSRNGTKITATIAFTANVPTYFMGILGHSTVPVSGTSTATYGLPTFINFYLLTDVSGSMSFPSTSAEQARLMAVNPDNLTGSQGYPAGCQFACHFAAQGSCQQSAVSGWQVGQGPIPAVGKPTNPNPGGYCQGFIISRLGTTPTFFTSGTTNTTNGNKVNWSNTPVTSCPTAGTTDCIQLRADAVGYAVTQLLTTAATTESNDGVANQFKVGLYPFIVNVDTGYSPLTTSISSGSAIYAAATNLANELDTGQNAALGSGGTHFEIALSTMNSLITSVGTGTSSSNALPYVFLITDGSEDYQTQSNGSWSSENWSATAAVPNNNSATFMPPNSVTSTDYCKTLKNRGITIAVLYIPYQPIQNPNSSFANDEDGYANNNIPNIPGALQSCASPNFFYTASTPAAINSALVTMFEQAVSTAHITN